MPSPRAVARLSARSASNPKSERCAWCALRSQVRSLLVLGALYLAKSDPSALSVTPTLSSSTIDPKDTATNFLLNLVSNCPMYPLNFRVKRQWKIRSIDDTPLRPPLDISFTSNSPRSSPNLLRTNLAAESISLLASPSFVPTLLPLIDQPKSALLPPAVSTLLRSVHVTSTLSILPDLSHHRHSVRLLKPQRYLLADLHRPSQPLSYPIDPGHCQKAASSPHYPHHFLDIIAVHSSSLSPPSPVQSGFLCFKSYN
ncbi:hypothetical protein PGT21_010686 [Puccinia graminis f. sp. tritici]|uniref:Uncharacterized protein n=1 Tax=Puccinia graminis f. sp. tritici TaxID=56615 RepID=A0A5B0NZH4_PUCGR|nr:hypothetical protein PGT21_010686 [Puccinia graminis f. sp. tritici]